MSENEEQKKKAKQVGKILQVTAKQNVKDSVFTNLFGIPKYLFQMYQALHPEDTETKQDDINIVTLENVLVNDIYNDVGFLVGDKLICLVEAQSTWTMNILIRVLFYYDKTLKEYLSERNIDLYSSVKADIPKPEFYVVYTGDRKNRPEIIRLAEEFFEGEDIGLDVRVKMLYGDTEDIIGEYVTFTKVYNEQYRIYGRTETAIRETIRICKDKNVLREYLETREKEVVDIMSFLFDDEYIMRAHDKTVEQRGYNKGYDKGEDVGYNRGKDEVRLEHITKMLERGFTDEQILDWDFTADEIQKVKETMKKDS